mmetsp:Transcript_124902/g.266561  ORF Transcript_124902/g.266561 Transcript_124902/m.266561 type:complete len:351 (-) Transcript_124902:104-1156(-)
MADWEGLISVLPNGRVQVHSVIPAHEFGARGLLVDRTALREQAYKMCSILPKTIKRKRTNPAHVWRHGLRCDRFDPLVPYGTQQENTMTIFAEACNPEAVHFPTGQLGGEFSDSVQGAYTRLRHRTLHNALRLSGLQVVTPAFCSEIIRNLIFMLCVLAVDFIIVERLKEGDPHRACVRRQIRRFANTLLKDRDHVHEVIAIDHHVVIQGPVSVVNGVFMRRPPITHLLSHVERFVFKSGLDDHICPIRGVQIAWDDDDKKMPPQGMTHGCLCQPSLACHVEDIACPTHAARLIHAIEANASVIPTIARIRQVDVCLHTFDTGATAKRREKGRKHWFASCGRLQSMHLRE